MRLREELKVLDLRNNVFIQDLMPHELQDDRPR